ncbi:MAG: MFS transporter [Dehalococcoidia bacterium]
MRMPSDQRADTSTVATSARPQDGVAPNRALLLLTVSLGGVLAPLNSTMLAVALPEIGEAFAVSAGRVTWLVSAYLIAMAVAQPLGGRIGDQLGRARVFRAGLLAFLGFSIGAAFAPSFPVLVLFRAGQALTGAAVIPNGMAMLRASVPVAELGRTIGINGSVLSASAAAGPVVGAALVGLGSWRLLFLINVPLVAVALLCQAWLGFRDGRPRERFVADWLGAVAFAALLTLTTLLLNALRGGVNPVAVAAGIVGLVGCTWLFVRRQRTGPLPLTDWRLFRRRSFAASTVYILLSNLVMYTTLLTIPFFLKEVQGRGATAAGLLLASLSVLMAVLAPGAGRLSDAWGRRLPALVGSCFVAGGVVLLLAGLRADAGYGYLAASLAVLGLGMGLSTGPASTAAIETAPAGLAATASGTNSMMRYLGSIVGAGILGAVLSSGDTAPGIGVFRLIFAVLLVLAVVAVVAAAGIHRFPAPDE